MTPVLQCKDHWGRDIILRAERWISHIVALHGEMKDCLSSIEQTLGEPNWVTRDVRFGNREVSYRFGALPDPLDHLYLKVVVQFDDWAGEGIIGIVVTAYPVARIKRSEVQRWP